MSDDQELPPPLEDFSSLLKSKQTEHIKPKQGCPWSGHGNKIIKENKNDLPVKISKAEKSKPICGFQSGFLNKKKKKKKKKTKDQTTKKLIEPTKNSDDLLLLDSVKEKLLSDTSFYDSVLNDKELTYAMMKPKFAYAIRELELNPRETLKKYKGDPEVIPVLQKFMAKIGEGFEKSGMGNEIERTDLGNQLKSSSGIEEVGGDSVKNAKPSLEKIQRWMQDPVVMSAFEDPEVQDIIQQAQGSPDLILKHIDHPKIKILIDYGIVQINR